MYGREKLKKQINRAIAIHPTDYGQVCYFYGRSGVGKTTLYNYIQKEILADDGGNQANYEKVFLDLRAIDVSERYKLLRHFYDQLKNKSGFFFPEYELICSYLSKTHGGEKYKIDSPKSLSLVCLEKVVDTLLAKVDYTGLLTLINNSLRETMGEKAECKAVEVLLKEMSSSNPAEYLLEFFVRGFNDSLQTLNQRGESDPYHVIIAVDSFESRFHTRTIDWFTKELIPKMQGTTWFIFGTEEEVSFPQNGIMCISQKVELFDEITTRAYLKLEGVDDQSIQDTIIERSHGLPAAIQVFLQIYRAEGKLEYEAEYEGYHNLFYNYFHNHIDEKYQVIIKRLSVFDDWDEEIYRHIDSNNLNEGFQWLAENTALVEQFNGDNPITTRYRFVNVISESFSKTFETEDRDGMKEAYQKKFDYFRNKANNEIKRIIEMRRDQKIISNETYKNLANYTLTAFKSAVQGYVIADDFLDYSNWCIDTEQFMTEIGFFDLKSILLKVYIDGVMERDGFVFDDEENQFYLCALRDLTWAYRNTGAWNEAINSASLYYNECLKRYGGFDVHIPFSLYLLGLTYQDIYDVETAELLLEQSLSLFNALENKLKEIYMCRYGEEEGEDRLHPDSSDSIRVLAGSILGLIKMNAEKFPEAKELLLTSQNSRRETDYLGKQIGFSNLSKLYFIWGQSEGKKKHTELSSKYLEEACTYLKKAEKVYNNTSDKELLNIETRKVSLSIAMCIATGNTEDNVKWNEYVDHLHEIKERLNGIGQPSSTYPLELCIENNIAVIYAMQRNFDDAKEVFTQCLEKKRNKYSILQKENINPMTFNRVSHCMSRRSTIVETEKNLEAVEKYIKTPNRPFNPYEFILQY